MNNIFNNLIDSLSQEFKNFNNNKNKTFVVAGGVAANKKIREILIKLCKEILFFPIFYIYLDLKINL